MTRVSTEEDRKKKRFLKLSATASSSQYFQLKLFQACSSVVAQHFFSSRVQFFLSQISSSSFVVVVVAAANGLFYSPYGLRRELPTYLTSWRHKSSSGPRVWTRLFSQSQVKWSLFAKSTTRGGTTKKPSVSSKGKCCTHFFSLSGDGKKLLSTFFPLLLLLLSCRQLHFQSWADKHLDVRTIKTNNSWTEKNLKTKYEKCRWKISHPYSIEKPS